MGEQNEGSTGTQTPRGRRLESQLVGWERGSLMPVRLLSPRPRRWHRTRSILLPSPRPEGGPCRLCCTHRTCSLPSRERDAHAAFPGSFALGGRTQRATAKRLTPSMAVLGGRVCTRTSFPELGPGAKRPLCRGAIPSRDRGHT